MPYSKQTWVDNNANYPLSASRLNYIEDGIEAAYMIGQELGYAERTTADTTTNTNTGATAANKIAGLSLTVVGTGRPIQVEVELLAMHSVVDSWVGVQLLESIDGGAQNAIVQLGSIPSRSTSRVTNLSVNSRRLIPLGEQRTYDVGKYLLGAGTGTFGADPLYPMFMVATQR